ncbi:carbohydrate ABC transporter permease [Bifidobacterium imperatoris]|uniref:Carbohydrate ABC transporter permease n=1 Tax=Bifidobacterium imperatoris TaxID=2020965 RepID=A0A2N5ITU6_9BIFI|nr:carbohydrate ABC transporter permease [Bifidobacterium imperatoris]PLS25347.1 sugar ABC transporter permease [Bifidobacterium imperatoris]QSY58494.1 carbohydrate ABC transporter permease [Bifidobacterium imperatoris]
MNILNRNRSKAIAVNPWVRLVVILFFVAGFCYFILPVIWLFIAATKTSGDLYNTPSFEFANFHLFQNIAATFQYDNGIYARWLLNSVIYSGLGSVLTVLVSALCGHALAVYRFPGRGIILGVVTASFMIPGTALTQPQYLLLVKLGLNRNMLGLLLPALVYPFGVVLCWVAERAAVPYEIIEAARVDGAGEWRIFFQIVLPMMPVGLTTVFLFAFMGSWNNYMLPLMLFNDPKLYPVTVGLAGWNKQSVALPDLGTVTLVGAFVSILPLIIIFVISQRYWKTGLSAGAVKV